MQNDYKGYSIFNDVKDEELRNLNRGTVMANIFEDHPREEELETTTQKGAFLIFGYMNSIPKEEREAVCTQFTRVMKERGYIHGA